MRAQSLALTFRYATGVYSAPAGKSPSDAASLVTQASITALSAGQSVDSDPVTTEHILDGDLLAAFSGNVAGGSLIQVFGSNDEGNSGKDYSGSAVPGERGVPQNWTPQAIAQTSVTGTPPGPVDLPLPSRLPYRWLKFRFLSGGTCTGNFSGRITIKGPN